MTDLVNLSAEFIREIRSMLCGGFSKSQGKMKLESESWVLLCVWLSAVALRTAILCGSRYHLRWSLTLMTRILQTLLKVGPFILTSSPSANKLTCARSFCEEKDADDEIWKTNSEAELSYDTNLALKYLCTQVVLIRVSKLCEATKYQTHKSRHNNLIQSRPSASCFSVLTTNGQSSRVWCWQGCSTRKKSSPSKKKKGKEPK